MNKQKGITLVALVITIIILLILAGITLNLVLGNDGLIEKAKNGGNNYKLEAAKEQNVLNDINSFINGEYVANSSEVPNNEPQLPNLEITEDVENINTSAKVSAIEGRKITINSETLKASTLTGGFEVGSKVMLYVSNTNSATLVGKYELYDILSISENEITLSGDIDTDIFTDTNCQLVKIAKYGTVTINSGVTVTPSTYDGNSGGIVAIDANEIILNGKIDASKSGYHSDYTSPLNGTKEVEGVGANPSRSGGSNKYKGGNGGKDYQGYIAEAPDAISITNNIQEKRMTFGGGSYYSVQGGGIIYLNTKKLEIGSQYAISANGQAGKGVESGGAAGGTVCINAKNIVFTTQDKDYFVGANAGGGGTEGYNGGWPAFAGEDGTNIKAGDATGNCNGKSGGAGYLSNGGGGAQQAYNGNDATATQGGSGADATNWSGWNAGSGGGGRRIC